MRTLVFGGAASGKSEYAEALALLSPLPRVYVATMQPFGDEALRRIERHRRMRAEKGFCSVDRCTDLGGLPLASPACVLLEDLGNLVANELFSPEGAGERAAEAVLRGVRHLETAAGELIVVSNDVFGDGAQYAEGTMRYMQALAEAHRAIAERFERVVEVVCGLPVVWKDEQGRRGA